MTRYKIELVFSRASTGVARTRQVFREFSSANEAIQHCKVLVMDISLEYGEIKIHGISIQECGK